MKKLILLFLFFSSLNLLAVPGDKEDLINAWETIQKDSSAVEIFERVEPNKYKIKFSVLPFEGDMNVLTFDIEDLGYAVNKKFPINKMAYIEVDLVGASDEFFDRYSRSYYKWAQTNTLYFNEETNAWISSEEYTKVLGDSGIYDQPSFGIFSLFNYWYYFFIAIVIYFIYSAYAGNKRVKEALDFQKSSVEKSLALQQKAFDVGAKMHAETNKILEQVLAELKNKES